MSSASLTIQCVFSLWWGQQEAKRFRFARSEPLFIRPFSILKRNRYHKSENHREDFKNSPLLVSSTRPFTSIINGRAHQWVKVEKSWFFSLFSFDRILTHGVFASKRVCQRFHHDTRIHFPYWNQEKEMGVSTHNPIHLTNPPNELFFHAHQQ